MENNNTKQPALQPHTTFSDMSLDEFIHRILPTLKKPLYQRAMYWLLNKDPKKTHIPNCKDFVDFVRKHNAAVQRIHLAVNGKEMSLMDGNNRIHALLLCIERPYKLYPEYYLNVFSKIDNLFPPNKDTLKNNNRLKEFFENASYRTIRNWTDLKNGFGTEIYDNIIKHNMANEDFIEFTEIVSDLKNKWGPNKTDSSQSIDLLKDIKLSFAQYHNYTVEQQIQTFEDTNRYDSTMTKRDAISANLCFVNAPMNDEWKNKLCKYAESYLNNKRSNVEVLINLPNDKRINIKELKAFDYLVALNDSLSEEYDLFCKYNDFCEIKKGGGNNKTVLPVIFDLFNSMYNINFTSQVYGDEINKSLFTKENIDDFNCRFPRACKLLRETLDDMYPDKIEEELFNKNDLRYGKNFDKTKLLIIFTLIIKEQKQGCYTNDIEIKKCLKKCLFFHFFRIKFNKYNYDEEKKARYEALDDMLNEKEKRGHLKTFIPKTKKKSLFKIAEKITKPIFKELLNQINKEIINQIEYSKKNKRKKHNYFKKVMMTMFYFSKMPNEFLTNNVKYEIDHLIPHSIHWDEKSEIDICRLGNLVPVLKGLNQARKNGDISIYYSQNYYKFSKNLNSLLYSKEEYNRIVTYVKSHSNNVAHFLSNDAIQIYNHRCSKNEEHYINNFLDVIYTN